MTSNMATLLKNVIRNGGMPLSQVHERIETMYLSGRINGEERAELTEMMHEKADPYNEAGDYKQMYEALVLKYNELEKRVSALENADNVSGGEEEEGDANQNDPEWEPWDGVSDKYQTGAMVMHNGTVWESVFAGQNVWEPGAPGIDERYWVAAGKTPEEAIAE